MISARTLLLNSTYEPLLVISWQRATTMLYLGKVEVLRSYDSWLRSASTRMRTPAVVRLTHFVRRHRARIAFSRRNVFLRDGYRCQYCEAPLPAHDLTTDHVIPRSLGGKTTWDNVVAACAPCNRKKGGRTPGQARMQLLRKPTRPANLPALAVQLSHASPPDAWREFLRYAT